MDETYEQAFKNLKELLSTESFVSYFDNDKDIFIFYTDTSPYVISAILFEKLRKQ